MLRKARGCCESSTWQNITSAANASSREVSPCGSAGSIRQIRNGLLDILCWSSFRCSCAASRRWRVASCVPGSAGSPLTTVRKAKIAISLA